MSSHHQTERSAWPTIELRVPRRWNPAANRHRVYATSHTDLRALRGKKLTGSSLQQEFGARTIAWSSPMLGTDTAPDLTPTVDQPIAQLGVDDAPFALVTWDGFASGSPARVSEGDQIMFR